MAHMAWCASQWLTNMTEGRSNPAICWLGQAECHDSALVGGKAAHLSQLSAAVRVPPGFCLTTAAFDHAALDGHDEEVIAQSRDGRIDDALYEALAQAYVQLGERCGQVAPSVAVRSSAVDEDGISASFAGQHETLLNVAGVEAVAQAAVQCWRSA